MNNKGFIATSIMYSFFIVFALMCLSILGTYSHYRTLNVNLNKSIKNELIDKIMEDNSIAREYSYSYTGDKQTFVAPKSGTYRIQLWGAQGGGNSTYPGGYGGYVSGDIQLIKDDTLYIYVGESNSNVGESVYNNGRKNKSVSGSPVYAGGGSTDVRLASGDDTNFDSLKTRIMVAAAGGGSVIYWNSQSGANAGGLVGYDGTKSGSNGRVAQGGTQTSAGLNGGIFNNYNDPSLGTFGYPAYGDSAMGGGGNGWYPGGTGPHHEGTVGPGAGGSSFIAGHSGCNAINISSSTSSSVVHTSSSTVTYNGKNYSFTNTKMIDGAGYNWTSSKGSLEAMPKPTGGSYGSGLGNTGNGYAKIFLLD